MNTINDRVAAIVDELGISRSAFAKKLNVSGAFVSKVCAYKSGLSERTIIDICHTFRVNEGWLRFGEGEMFVPQTREEEIEAFFATISEAPMDDFRRHLISVLAKLSVDQWELLADMAQKLADEAQKEPGHE